MRQTHKYHKTEHFIAGEVYSTLCIMGRVRMA